MKILYKRPRLHTLGDAQRTAACVVGSAAAASGWSCNDGGGVFGLCKPFGNGAVDVTITVCYTGNGAVGIWNACDNGINASTTAKGNACVAGGDK